MTRKRTSLILCLPLLLTVTLCHGALAATTKGKEAQNMDKLTANIHWLGHDSFRIDGEGVVIYIDPYRLKEGPKADLILITHDHSDHASMSDVALIQKQDTVIVTIKAAAQKLSGQIKTVLPGEELTEKGVLIKTLPAYNLTKFRSPGVPYHPKDSGHVGYLISVKGVTIYHPGDTDFIPEMKGLKPDVALLPVSGTYVMTAEEAAEAAAAIQPKVAIQGAPTTAVDPSVLQAAVDLCPGDFLEGFSMSDSAPFEEWVTLKREQISRRMFRALRSLADHFERQGDYEQARNYAQRQVERGPVAGGGAPAVDVRARGRRPPRGPRSRNSRPAAACWPRNWTSPPGEKRFCCTRQSVMAS